MSSIPKILLVDDRAQNLLALEIQLREHDAELLQASNGDEALEILLKHEVALAVVDVQMPEMDGFALAELMRGSPRTQHIPIIFVTAGLHDRARVFQGYEAGAVDFLVKPIDPIVLRSKVAVFLELSRQKHELRDRVRELETALAERRRAEDQLAADHAALLRLHGLNARLLSQEALPELLDATVEAAVALTGADRGTMQLFDAADHRLTIVAHCGFEPPFLEHFARVRDGDAVCGRAARDHQTVIVTDVEASELFRDPRTLAVFAEAHVRGVLSTPLHSRRGSLLGVVSTHWSRPHTPSENTLRLLDLLARQAADLLEFRQREESLAEMNARLIEENRRKNAFLATLSHELRNPLAPITNSLYVLEHSELATEQTSRAKVVIARQVRQLASLIDDLLDVTRITSNKINLQRKRVELNELVRRATEDCRSLFDENQVALEVELGSTPLFVHADSTRLAQVVSNLLQNAAKFTGPGGNTKVSVEDHHAPRELGDAEARTHSAGEKARCEQARCEPIAGQARLGEAVIRVTDDGVGMSAETLASLFEPFMQAEQTLARSQGGLGLGLALVKGIVELHGGRVEATSHGLGKGAEFVIRLPLVEHTAAEPATAPPNSGVIARCRVLVIEDNVDAADSLKEVLELGDHVVEVAYDGPAGLAKAKVFRPEIVLCDIGLPGMDGFEVARAFRADGNLRGARLVALSGYALPEDIQRAADAGFEQHLAKPPSLQKLEELFVGLRPGSSAS